MTRARRALWVPPFLLGSAIATAVGTGAGILLYNDEGLLRAALVLAGVNLAAMAVGLRMAGTGEVRRDPLAGRWWLGLMISLLAGAGFAVVWEGMDAFAAAPPAQGLGLALTSALPGYCAAGTWARLGALEALMCRGRRRQTNLGSAAGAVGGALLVVVFLGRPVWAVTAFLVAMVLGSAGARLHVWILDRMPRLFKALEDPERPALHFEEWRTLLPEKRARALREGRRWLVIDPPPPGDWRSCVATTLDPGCQVLFMGIGSWFEPSQAWEWRICEADEGVRALAARGFEWEEHSLADSPVADVGGRVVLADLEAATAIRPAALREAGAARIWIGGSPNSLPDSFREEARAAGFAVARYRSAVAGIQGPPHVEPRADEVWCLDSAAAPPESVEGMVAVPFDPQPDGNGARDADEATGREATGREATGREATGRTVPEPS